MLVSVILVVHCLPKNAVLLFPLQEISPLLCVNCHIRSIVEVCS